MGLYDDDGVAFQAYAADTHAALAQQDSLFGNIGNVITKSVPLTALSVVNSFYNTGVDVANFFGAELKHVTAADEMRAMGADDYASFYDSHQQGIEAVALAAGSFIPGLAAVKAIKVMQSGKFGEIASRATNLFMSPTDQLVKETEAVIKAGDAAMFPSLNVDKFKALALGFRDQAVQALAFEAASLATQHGSPLLENQSLENAVIDSSFGMLIGGGLGGAIEGAYVRGIFKRAAVSADLSTKAFETVKRLGFRDDATSFGTSIAGERVAYLLDSVFKIPDPTGFGALAARKAQTTTTNAILDAKAMLQQFAPEGQEELTNSLFDMIYKGRKAGMSKDDMWDMLGGLAKVSPVGTKPSVPVTDAFYINKFTPAVAANLSDPFSAMISTVPHVNANVSRRFVLDPYATDVRIARANDTFVDNNGVTQILYTDAKDAFNNGNDIWIGPTGATVIHPNPPNLIEIPRAGEGRILTEKEMKVFDRTYQLPPGSEQPITGAPLVVNVMDGTIKSEAIPVPGDLMNVKARGNGVTFGRNEFSPQSLAEPLTAATPTMDASARYIWAAARGLRKGDVIEDADIPMLEAMLREGQRSGKSWTDFIADTQRYKNVSFASGEDLPQTVDELLTKIRGAKDDLISDLQSNPANKRMSSEEIARRANVPEKYMENGFSANVPTDYIVDADTLSKVNHVQLEYNIGNTQFQNGQIVRGEVDANYRIQLMKDAAKTALTKTYGQDGEHLIIGSYSSKDATISGDAAPGHLTFANSDYGTLGEAAQRVGRFITNMVQKQVTPIMSKLAPFVSEIRTNKEAAAEWGMFTNIRRGTSENYTFLPEALVMKYMPDVLPANRQNVAVLTKSLVRDKTGAIADWQRSYQPEGFLPGASRAALSASPTAAQTGIPAQQGFKTFYELSEAVGGLERAHMEINDARIMKRNDFYSAQGVDRAIEAGNLYAPPIDVGKYPHVALVRPKEGRAFADDSVAVIVGENADSLLNKINLVDHENFDVFTKDQLQKYHEVKGDYDYSRNFNTGFANSELRRRGVFSDVFPTTRDETLIADLRDFHQRQEIRLLRDYTELGNAQLFSEAKALKDAYLAPSTSQVNWLPAFLAKKEADNPYRDYINTALGIAKEPYKLWHESQEVLESFADSAYRSVRQSFESFKKGVIPLEEATAMAEKMGLGNPYGKAVDAAKAYGLANQLPPGRELTRFVNMANMIQAAGAIRLDTFQSLINVVSAPILTLTELWSAKSAAVRQLSSLSLPGTQGAVQIPSMLKVIAGGIGDWWNPTTRAQWLPLLKDMGIVRDVVSDYHNAMELMSLPGGKVEPSYFTTKIKELTDLGSKLTGSQLTENFVRYTAAMMAKRVFEAAGVTGTDLLDNMGTFVNRVHGNYIASQRPMAFQGPIGAAASLFQTYQVNLLQQMFKHVQDGEGKTLAIFAGLQGTLFGIQGLPGFQLLNQHLIGNAVSNPSHTDIYNTAISFSGKELSDYLMYGIVSGLTNTGLYSRGDINPRNISIIPINPLEFPAISGGISFLTNLAKSLERVKDGGALWSIFTQGMEHNGLSRPLTGFAQMVQGYTTTSEGSITSTTRPNFSDGTMGWNDVFNFAYYGRMFGARPLDEAVALDANYKKVLYQAKDLSRMEALGEAVKSRLIGGGSIPASAVDEFTSRYAQSGGYMPNYSQSIMKWGRDANTSQVNEIFQHLERPLNQNLMQIMGGQMLPDYRNLGSTRASAPAPSRSDLQPEGMATAGSNR